MKVTILYPGDAVKPNIAGIFDKCDAVLVSQDIEFDLRCELKARLKNKFHSLWPPRLYGARHDSKSIAGYFRIQESQLELVCATSLWEKTTVAGRVERLKNAERRLQKAAAKHQAAEAELEEARSQVLSR